MIRLVYFLSPRPWIMGPLFVLLVALALRGMGLLKNEPAENLWMLMGIFAFFGVYVAARCHRAWAKADRPTEPPVRI